MSPCNNRPARRARRGSVPSAGWTIAALATACPWQRWAHVEAAGIAERARELTVDKDSASRLLAARLGFVGRDQAIHDRLNRGGFIGGEIKPRPRPHGGRRLGFARLPGQYTAWKITRGSPRRQAGSDKQRGRREQATTRHASVPAHAHRIQLWKEGCHYRAVWTILSQPIRFQPMSGLPPSRARRDA